MKKTGQDSLNSWVIAAACCFINVMMFGMMRLSGILFVASGSRFLVSREKASFPYTFASFMRNISGPLVGHLSHKFGVRSVTTFGCTLSAVGAGLCFFADNIQMVTIFWGVIFGLGYGLGNILLPVSINQHFIKNRASASGLSYSGASLGSFILPPIVEFLINKYGLSGTFLILCGFLMNCIPAALLLRKPKSEIIYNSKSFDRKKCKNHSTSNETLYISGCQPQERNLTYNLAISVQNGQHNYGYEEEMTKFKEKRVSKIAPVTQNMSTDSTPLQHVHHNDNYFKSDIIGTDGVKYLSQHMEFSKASNSFLNLEFSKTINSKENCANVTDTKGKRSSFFRSLVILIDPMFNLIAITGAIYAITFVCIFTIITDFARDLDIGISNEKYILMLLSIGDLFGRLGLGWVTDSGYMTPTRFIALLYAAQGIAIAATAWSNGFISLVVLITFYGVAEGGIVVFSPVIFAEYMDYEQQIIAIPYSNFFSGPVCLTVSPLIGYFRDNNGSYSSILYLVALLSFAGSFSWMLAPCITKCRRKSDG